MLDNALSQPSKFGIKSLVEIIDDSHGITSNSQTKFKTSMLKWSLFEYSDV